MDLPGGVETLLAFVALGLPIAVFATVRRYLLGETATDRDWSIALVQGVSFAAILAGFYVSVGLLDLFAVESTSDGSSVQFSDPRQFATASLGLFVIVPALVSFMIFAKHCTWKRFERRRFSWLRYPASKYGYSSEPTSWDFAVKSHSESGAWLKVRRESGAWVGGWFATGSFASMYPEPPAVYLHSQWALDGEGNFRVCCTDR
ncbi:DUF6338 family protein [Microcella pacifica]|uniref:Uncharacterized protein n=1 Tax=Microcella pacifica TaxID=2591847 RepID=A0A9E5JP18_9MICO|nr:DUF6338 family protein [Microcella pacifica]NHF64165.1 hypothetical protein [Microcella pacifica]